MMNPVQKLVPEYDQVRGRWASVSRDDIAGATRRAYDGVPVGLYREGDDLYPILLRHNEAERKNATEMDTLQVQPALYTKTVPLAQVTKDIRVEWEDPIINRWERRRCVSIQALPVLPRLISRAALCSGYMGSLLSTGMISRPDATRAMRAWTS